MNTEEGILMLKGMVSELPEQDQQKVKEVQSAIRKLVEDNGDIGFLALSITAPEIALEWEAK